MRLALSTNTLFLLRKLENDAIRKAAPFRSRLMAFLIDHVLFCTMFGLLLSLVWHEKGLEIKHQLSSASFTSLQDIYLFLLAHPIVMVSLGITHWLYFALFESSGFQATPGKLALHVGLVTLYREPVTFWQASFRHLCKMLLFVPAGLTYWVGIFSPKKQMLHDSITGCLHMTR